MKEENFDEINAKQVQEKLTKLRNYYGAERRKEEKSKVSGSGTDSLYVSSWRFYESLHFLKDTLTPRATVSNIDGEYDEDAVYKISNPPSAKAARKIREKNRENVYCVMAKTSKTLESMTARYQETPQERKMYRGEDGSFADMVYEMLCNIPDSREKAMAKLEFQHKLIQLKYNIPVGVSNTTAFNPFTHSHGFSSTSSHHNSSATITPLSSPAYPSF